MTQPETDYVPELRTRCSSPEDLHQWLQTFLGIDVPFAPVCPHHNAPFEYLCRSYFEPGIDLVVWAPRGGGKTRLAAAATLLDLIHKPGASVRILGGSLEQSLRMWEHLLPDLQRLDVCKLARPTTRRISLASGSSAAVLTQSQRAVRGLRVQKLRCDEVELFDPAVWEAAQLVTRSHAAARSHNAATAEASDRACGDAQQTVRGTIEAISTFHAPYGLMSKVVDSAGTHGKLVLRWCLLEVLQRCPAERECASCPLWDDCRGVAKTRCDGFVPIDDAIAMKRRVSLETWEAEMLCKRPSVTGCVFPHFDPAMHVRESYQSSVVSCQETEERSSTSSALSADNRQPTTDNCSLAVDFGFANPFVCLWVGEEDGCVFVIDEYVQEARTVEEHLRHIEGRQWGAVRNVVCDPAGSGRNDQTAESNVQLLRRNGYVVKCRPSRIVDGVEMIRAALRPATGEPKLLIHPRCVRLIRALREYHYAQDPLARSELPLKDGEHDHLIDALRYYFVNRPTSSSRPSRKY